MFRGLFSGLLSGQHKAGRQGGGGMPEAPPGQQPQQWSGPVDYTKMQPQRQEYVTDPLASQQGGAGQTGGMSGLVGDIMGNYLDNKMGKFNSVGKALDNKNGWSGILAKWFGAGA